MSLPKLIGVIFLAGVLFALECVLVHEVYVAHTVGGNDFYPRWAGVRALLLEGRDPYDPLLTEEIAAVLDPNDTGSNSFSFAYPLHVAFFMGPLALFSYDWAYAIWMVTLQWAAFLLIAVLLMYHGWRPSPPALAGLFLATLSFYPITRSIILGQFTIHMTLFVAASLLALRRGYDAAAGAILAATSIKPQMVLFLAPALLLWVIRQRRRRFVAGFIGGGLFFLAGSLLLFPRWPISFLEDIPRYSAAAGGRAPLAIVSEMLAPLPAPLVTSLVATALLGAMLLAWLRAYRTPADYFEQAIHWTILATLLVPFQTGSTSQVLLVIPLFAGLAAGLRRWGRAIPTVMAAAALTGLWLLFLTTFAGESAIMFVALPFFVLALLALQEVEWFARATAGRKRKAQDMAG